jgi:hypothetical protein
VEEVGQAGEKIWPPVASVSLYREYWDCMPLIVSDRTE